MDGNFYIDCKPPFPVNTVTTTTLTTSNQNIWPSSHLPLLGGYFNYPGKLLYMRGWGVCTSGATPGNFGINFFWGNNTANNGTNLSNVSYTWTASQTNTSFSFELWVRCRATGVSGQVFSYGNVFVAGSGVIHHPFNGATNNVTIDTTLNNYISPQVNRSGSTAETITPYHIFTQSLN